MTEVGRFAPSTTGPAHPGTLLAALLCWLDARSRGARLVLRLENLDPQRARPPYTERMQEDLAWLGLDWDLVEVQSRHGERHEQAIDRLAALGRLYPCACSRSRLRETGERAPDGSHRYDGRCRERPLPAGGWRESPEPLRVRLDPGTIPVRDESGGDLSQDAATLFGDPVVRRRDGAVAYHLASVVDDAAVGVTRVVRGRDLAASTVTQVALRHLLGLPVPSYRHHFLLLESRSDAPTDRAEPISGEKLAKLHGAVAIDALRAHYDAPSLAGWLAHAAGLQGQPTPQLLAELLPSFDWIRVPHEDRLVRWTGQALVLVT